ncbi:unnamed protein product (macronuclear) [Paramecium tetraurelia]|uniref:Uncharacterized protein n=1 Tax=Paramecium tetraurelia TaxID=5888 RepID=A0DA96_PARTE|nr:uncharacterized protein GSPATT00014870001 [Paramecium tetraurelia]CAK79963.1 unnamed protein product [Paramecium tetraurelia]|eukprot:XP_001447360.1 hypothetical protein (macronuclear) [Paramecium tetraurelia strain d4-2]
MIQNGETKYIVKYEDGSVEEIVCEPFQIKKVISKQFLVPYENIVLINADNYRMYSATNSYFQFKNNTIHLNVMDINQILKENLNSKKKIYELQNNEEDLRKELVQIQESNIQSNMQMKKLKGNDQSILIQKDQNFIELQRMDQQYKEKLVTQQMLYEQKITQINQNKEQLQQENESLQRKIQELNQITQKQERQFQQQKQTLQQEGNNKLNYNHQIYETQIEKLYEEISNLQNQIFKKNHQIQQLENEIQENKSNYILKFEGLENEYRNLESYYKRKLLILEQGINDINQSTDLSDNNLMIKNYCNDALRELEYIKKDIDNQEKNRNQEMQTKLKIQNDELQQKVEKLQQQIKAVQNELTNTQSDQHFLQQKNQIEIDKLNAELNKAKKGLDQRQDEINQYLLIIDQLKSETKELNNDNENYECNIQKLQQAKIKLQADIEEWEQKYRLQHSKLLQSEQTVITKVGEIKVLESALEKQKMQCNKMNQKIIRLSEILKQINNKNLGKGLEKVVSPVGQLLNSRYGLVKFRDNPNCQSDETDYLAYRIKPSNNFLQSIKRGSFVNLEQLLDVELLGEVKTIRSIQPNEEGDLMKVYIIKIENTQINELKNRYLIRKDLSKGQNYDNKLNAAALSLNNIITQVFLDQFVKDLAKLSIKPLNFSIAPQYVLQQKGKELYYYCEEIIEFKIKQINGGEQNLGSSKEEQFLNSFCKYSHMLSQQELFITYINTVKQYLYDMIVTTEFGCFSEIDQGKDEYIRAQDAIESANASNFGEFYNQKLELKALEFIQ